MFQPQKLNYQEKMDITTSLSSLELESIFCKLILVASNIYEKVFLENEIVGKPISVAILKSDNL